MLGTLLRNRIMPFLLMVLMTEVSYFNYSSGCQHWLYYCFGWFDSLNTGIHSFTFVFPRLYGWTHLSHCLALSWKLLWFQRIKREPFLLAFGALFCHVVFSIPRVLWSECGKKRWLSTISNSASRVRNIRLDKRVEMYRRWWKRKSSNPVAEVPWEICHFWL